MGRFLLVDVVLLDEHFAFGNAKAKEPETYKTKGGGFRDCIELIANVRHERATVTSCRNDDIFRKS